MNRILIVGALAVAAATQAFAADLPPPMAPPPRAPAAYIPVAPAWSWTGFYIGLNAGYGFGNSTWTAPGFTTGSFDVNGGMAGGTLGANYQFGQFVVGLEGDYDWQNIRGASNNAAVCISCDTASSWVATVRGRAGYAWDRVLFYGTAGGAFTDIKASFGALPWQSSTQAGWTAGAGLEGAITDNWTAKVEYLYADFGNVSCNAASCFGTATVSLKENMVRAGINYKFGF